MTWNEEREGLEQAEYEGDVQGEIELLEGKLKREILKKGLLAALQAQQMDVFSKE